MSNDGLEDDVFGNTSARGKRVLDLTLTALAIPPALFIGALVAAAIKLEGDGPVLFVQDRIGKRGTIFKIVKFRSMAVDSPVVLTADGRTLTNEADPRISRVGRVIRSLSIDELPQIINVVRNEMSWVGPRPSLASALSTYQKDELPKFSVLPGITGFTQAYYRNSLSNRDKRLSDAWYAQNRTLKLDIQILLRTVVTVLKKENQQSLD